mgnify:FL=1
MIRCEWCEKMVTWVVSCLCRRIGCRDCAETHGCGTMKTLANLSSNLGFGPLDYGLTPAQVEE